MSGSGNGNGNGNGGEQPEEAPLDAVIRRLQASQEELDSDPLYAWKSTPVGHSVSIEQLHAGLLSVSQIAEAAIEMGVHSSADLKRVVEILPVIEQTTAQLRMLNESVSALHALVTSARKDVQYLKDEVADMSDRVRLVPAIKDMLKDILLRLPDKP